MTRGKKGLGRGLGAFFGDDVVEEAVKEKEEIYNSSTTENKALSNKKDTDETGKEITVKINRIIPNSEQPRKNFAEEQLNELAESIRQYGVLQPLLVQKKDDFYEIIAGERRWRAAKIAGLKELPVVIREYSKQQSIEIALIENVQREDLNPIEEAQAYQRLIQEFQLKQEEIAERVSKNRSTITNSIRLLKLMPEVQEMVAQGQISSGHARAILGVEQPEKQLELAKKIIDEQLSVRAAENAVKKLGKEPKEKKEDEALNLIFEELENRLKSVMSTKVNIKQGNSSKGKIEIEYYSTEELERIVDLIESIQN